MKNVIDAIEEKLQAQKTNIFLKGCEIEELKGKLEKAEKEIKHLKEQRDFADKEISALLEQMTEVKKENEKLKGENNS